MPARLVPLTPGGAPVVALQRPVLLVGRHPDCDVRLDLPAISRRHCCIALAYDRLLIRDLGSCHGLWVNGVRTEEVRLRPGDEIAIGPLLFRLEDPDAELDATAAAQRKPVSPHSLSSLPLDRSDPDGDLVPMSGNFPPM